MPPWPRTGLRLEDASDLFGRRGRQWLATVLPVLPPHRRYATERLLEQLEVVTTQILGFEQRLRAVFAPTPALQLLRTRPGVGWVLAVVLGLEIGDSARFPSAAHLAASAGTRPRVHASGGRIHSGSLRNDITRYPKWACIEAASTICLHRQARPHRHVCRRSARIQQRKGHPQAVGAIARHLAEASYWSLTTREPDPRTRGTPGIVHGGTRAGHAMSARRSALECDVPPGHPHAAETAKIWCR
jgi:transposase